MPCIECENGMWKWGVSGECQYDNEEDCREAHSGEKAVSFALLYPHIAARVFNTPLLIEHTQLRAITAALDDYALTRNIKLESVEAVRTGKHQISSILPNGIGVINIFGELVTRTHGISSVSGFTTYSMIAESFEELLNSNDVNKIVLNMHTPGGEVGLLFDLADKIYQARGKKRIEALINSKATSAGYLIARAAEKVFISQDGVTGSIGVVVEHRDDSALNEKMGVKYTLLYKGERKIDGAPYGPMSDAARASIMEKVVYYYNMFVEKVSLYSGLTQENIRATEANVFIGEQAVRNGLVDAIVNTNEFFQPERSIVMANESAIDLRMTELENKLGDALKALDSSEMARTQAEKDAKETKQHLLVVSRTIELRNIQSEVKTRFELIPGGDGKLEEFLLFIRETDEEQSKFIEATLATCNELLARSALEEVGNSIEKDSERGPTSSLMGVFEQFNTKVAAYKLVHPDIKEIDAIRAVQLSSPKLYSQYVRSMRKQSRDISTNE